MTSLQSRKLKVDKKFQPLCKEDGDEFYRNGIFEFNITQLLVFMEANPHRFQVEEISVKAARTYPSSNLSEATIKVANIANPIVLAEISPDRFNVIDGNHRLERAYREGIDKIFAYKVPAEQHVAFLTSVAVYKEYIQYWNSKIRQQVRA
jgi:hypothetical protein